MESKREEERDVNTYIPAVDNNKTRNGKERKGGR